MARFHHDRQTVGKVLVSVKGGEHIGPQFVRELLGTVETQKAQMGVLITLEPPTRGMMDAVNHSGTYKWRINDHIFPRIQVITVSVVAKRERSRACQR